MKRILITIIVSVAVLPLFSQQTLSLQECRELALKNNKSIQNADLSLEIARQQRKEAFTKYFPSISATGMSFMANKPMLSAELDVSSMIQPVINSAVPAITPLMLWLMQQGAPIDLSALGNLQSGMSEPQKIEMMKNGLIGAVMAVQPVFAGGQIVNGNKLAKAAVDVRQLQKELSENEVLLATETAFWQIVSLKEKLRTIDNSDTLLTRILSDVEVAVEAGLTTRNDLLRVELEQNKLHSGKLKAENGLKMLKMVLAQKIGIDAANFDIEVPSSLTDIAVNSPKPEELIVAEALSGNNTVENRPEYQLLDKSVDIARLQVDMEVGKNLPTVAIGAGYNYMKFDWHRDDGIKNDFAMAFATVSIPISGWWEGSHAIKRKKLELLQAENTRRENTELLLQQEQNAENGLLETYSQVQLALKSVVSAETNLKISYDNYQAGVTTLSSLLEAQNLLQQSRDQHTEALTEYYIKLAEWRQMKQTR